MTSDELLELLGEGVKAAAQALVEKAKAGEATASDIAQLRAMFRDAGGTMQFAGEPTDTGDAVLDSLSEVDPALLN